VKELEIRITLKGKGQHRIKRIIRVASKENKEGRNKEGFACFKLFMKQLNS
jgi:hypothetical protein